MCSGNFSHLSPLLLPPSPRGCVICWKCLSKFIAKCVHYMKTHTTPHTVYRTDANLVHPQHPPIWSLAKCQSLAYVCVYVCARKLGRNFPTTRLCSVTSPSQHSTVLRHSRALHKLGVVCAAILLFLVCFPSFPLSLFRTLRVGNKVESLRNVLRLNEFTHAAGPQGRRTN